jgi:hypothetical protein
MEEEIPAQESEDAKNIYESGRTMESRSRQTELQEFTCS